MAWNTNLYEVEDRQVWQVVNAAGSSLQPAS